MTFERRVSVLETAEALASRSIEGAAVAVVDVLRATTVLPLALAAGARRILPAASLDEARQIHAGLDPETTLLAGEREGRRVPGFDLGNSPLEYVPERVEGKTLVHASTNGSRALVLARSARLVVAASLVNARAAAGRLLLARIDVILVASGNAGVSAAEDLAGCGLLVHRLVAGEPGLTLDYAASHALALWRSWEGDVLGHLAAVPHAVYIAGLGFAEDLPVCAAVDSVPVVPTLTEQGLA